MTATTMPVPSYSSSIQDLRATIAHHYEQKRRLIEVFNAHSRAATLPASILGVIFIEQATSFYERRLASWDGVYDEYIGEPSHKAIYSWTAVSQVCRSWREAALHCPSLWTTVVLDERVKATFIRLLLDRSQGLPLTVVLHAAQDDYHCLGCSAKGDHGFQNYSDAVDILASILPRTRRISIFIDQEGHGEVWNVLKGLADASELEYLRLEATGSARLLRSTRARGDRASVVVPDALSSKTPPRLSSLAISGVRFEWSNTLLCTTIRCLQVSLYQFDKETHLRHLLNALRNMPQLESLDIDQVPPLRENDKPGRVSLPCLRNLRIPLDSKDIGPLLRSLDLPLTTSIMLFYEPPQFVFRGDKKGIPDDVQVCVVAAIKDFLAQEAVCAISYDHSSGHRLYDSPPVTSMWTSGQSETPDGDLLEWKAVEQRPPRIQLSVGLGSPVVTKLLAALDLGSVRVAWIRDNSPSPKDDLGYLRGAVNLTCLHVQGQAAIPLGGALCGWTRPAILDAAIPEQEEPPPKWYGFGEVDDDCWEVDTGEEVQDSSTSKPPADASREQQRPRGPPVPLLFPHLQVLGISQIDFPINGTDENSKAYRFKPRWWDLGDVPYGLDVKGILKSLRLRSGAGATQVNRIDFVNCECVEKEQLIPLVEAIPEVMWDGRRITMQDLADAGHMS